ncbi:MAG: SurA N-terminal domain-containing protein, partial [Acidobacteria bacterium]|nr:SurA N-terminal domain-containing protein [Acidobacteriota bacterium]
MLDVFRENLRSLKWILLLVVASFVVAIFAVWGGGITGGGTGGESWAASVDGRTIGVQEVLGRARRLDAAYRQLFGAEQYEQQRQNLDLIGQALEGLIEEQLLLGEGRRMGVRVTDGELQLEIRRHPDLQENGQFIGRDRYLNLARAGAFDVRQFEEGIRRELLLDRIRGLLEDGIRVSEAEIRE